MATPKIIGEGTYGCVAKPSLACKGTIMNYKNKVSKIMLKKYALSEYKEMKDITSIKNIDKYIISLPALCVPVPDVKFKKALQDCENKKFINTRDENFRLLVYEDGGVSLKQFTIDILPLLDRLNILIFLTRIYTLLEGLCFFNVHNIIHHDIKSRNIVYNIETNVIKFIDFGLVKRRSELIEECVKNENRMAQTWDNFPPEYTIANKQDYIYRGKTNYDDFIQRLAYTFDAYSFGIMMKSIVINITQSSAMKDPHDIAGLKEMFLFFNMMGDKNIETRDYDIFKFPEEYKTILKKHKLWCLDKGTPSMPAIGKQKKISTINMEISTEEMTHLKQVLSTKRNPCPENKERNPATKRCVNKCKSGYYRNNNFRCRKTVKGKPASGVAQCKDDKEMNPNTNRCVKKCKDGFVRNHLYLCRRPPKNK